MEIRTAETLTHFK
uniref:Uncharacterized protein n=1 Tax=Anguilla anguilla TaxID=7936 RepID=A0A0E9TDH6_ANGAN